MMKKIMLCIAMLMTIGLADVCADSDIIQHSYPVYKNGSLYMTLAVNETCDYGCDTANNRCNIVDSGYGLMATLAIMTFIIVSFWVSHILKRKESEEEDVPKATLSLVFMLLGMTGLLGLFVYVGGLVSGYDSSFLQVGAGMMNSLTNVWAIVLMVFPMIIVVFFLIRLVRDRLLDKRR